ncbi:MAG: TauD/TfdA family dioxygenase [Blastocatellia bacterium]
MNSPGSGKPGIKKLPQSRRRAINLSRRELVTGDYFKTEQTLPLVLQPAVAEVDLSAWAEENRDFIESQLLRHGGLLFRNFALEAAEDFERFCISVSDNLIEYRERSSPRSRIMGRVYSSTDYPADQSIFLHNEHSYSLTFPLRLYFYCATPAQSGGETPLADTRRILTRIDPSVKAAFANKHWMYVRNFGDGFGLPWQTVFQTTEKRIVEEYCRKSGIEYEWKEGERLRTRQVRSATTMHPRTGEEAWFNHATFFHVSTLEAGIRDFVLSQFMEEDLPNNTYYGDGSRIENSVLDHLREVYLEELVTFPWQKGDVLLLDNILAAHARAPYEGSRKILVTMADPVTQNPPLYN